MQQEKIKLPISRPVSSRCRPGLSPSLGGRPPVHTDPRDFQSTLPAHPGACLSLNHPRAGPPSSSPAPCTRNTPACTHMPCPPPCVLRAHGTRPPAHTPFPPMLCHLRRESTHCPSSPGPAAGEGPAWEAEGSGEIHGRDRDNRGHLQHGERLPGEQGRMDTLVNWRR